MKTSLTEAFARMLAANVGADRRIDRYGVSVEAASFDGSEFDLVLVFKAGESYCCAEPGCHVGYQESGWWRSFREILAEDGLGAIPRIKIRKIKGIVEVGARLGGPAGARRSTLSAGYTYETGPHGEIEIHG